MGAQLRLFEQYITRLRAIVGIEKAADIISKALFIISAGNNDVAFAYSFTIRRALPFDVYCGQLVSAAQNFLKVIHINHLHFNYNLFLGAFELYCLLKL
jgi:hypothetical protein